jgi:ferredoxin
MNARGARPDPNFMNELKQYGEFDILPCYNCGTCTAVCPLVERGESFPRRLVHFAKLGLRDRLAASKEVWSCYYCGECSKRCPRQATPGEFMDSARRYFISHWDVTTVSRRLYTSPKFTAVFMGVLGFILAALAVASGGALESDHLALFEFVDVEWLHYTGIAVFVIVGLILTLNIGNLVRQLIKTFPKPPKRSLVDLLKDAWLATRDTGRELAVQTRFHDCHTDFSEEPEEPWYLSRRVVHLAVMWGFLGLLGATSFDLLFKEPGSHVPLYYPSRLLGTIAGLVMLYGLTAALWLRMERRGGISFERSLLSDWLLLWMLWATGVSGFVLEVAVYLPEATLSGYVIFLVHVVLAMVLLLMLPFTKFAHAIYRPVALWIHAFWMHRDAHRSLRTLWAARPQRRDAA